MTPLEDLLQQCTVKITVPGGWGTGFFVASGWVLTCAHVVRKAADSPIALFYAARGVSLSAIATAKADDGETLDLALLKLSEPLPDHPCVLLDEESVAIGQALYSYGYLKSYPQGAPVRPVHEGLTGDVPPLLKLQGAQIEAGISGAALLNLRTGKVCGMVKETRAAGFDLGGGAIPTRVILEQFPELRELQRAFHEGDRRWRDVLVNPTPTEGIIQTNFGGHNYQTRTGANNTNYIGENHIYNYAAPQPEAGSSIGKIDFQPYLQAVVSHYSQQRHLYTPTDALLPLEARSVERQEGEDRQKKKVEQFPVLAGLRKYALGEKREHVLLAGRPGSGKSTALRQLVLALAEEAIQDPNLPIPVLVQLKADRSVPELIQAEFRRAKQRVTVEEIDDWLLDDRLILLLDGVNEVPTDKRRQALALYREDNLSVPIVFTTRDLAVGGDLGIGQRLEMKPLSPEQINVFVGKYLPEHGEQLLRQLRDRLRELAETPLLLKLLCDVFDPETNQIPQNRGELFQWFDRDYKRIKKEIEYVPVSENFWEFKSEILQYLAFSMIQGEVPTADRQEPPEP
ncbi:MAG TPA: trypsin-like peptidase domain-containing protein, partial [Candidatus Obscuribacterales bacterium]